MLPDPPPKIDLAEPVGRTVTGEMQLSYAAQDDHGVDGAQAEITLDLPQVDRRYGLGVDPLPREPLRIDLPLPVSGTSTEVTEVLVEDVSKHPWVGMPVKITLKAPTRSARRGVRCGHHRRAARAAVLRPDRRRAGRAAARPALVAGEPAPGDPGAARRDLSARGQLRQPARLSDDPHRDPRAGCAARPAGTGAAAIPEVAEALWQAALLIEDGGLSDAAERLARAQERLAEALQGDATDEEIAELMEELRQATRDYMEQMAREAIERGDMQRAETDPGQTMTQDQLQQLMDRIQELSEQGRRAEAEQLLEQLRQLLENMEMRFAQGGQGQGQQGQGGQAMQDLADTLREQQDLADDFVPASCSASSSRTGKAGPATGGQQGAAGPGRAQARRVSPTARRRCAS